MSRRNPENIQTFHISHLYTPTRTILMYGDVDIDMFENVAKNLLILDSTEGTITIYLNSGGGDLTEAMAIYDMISNCKNYVRIIVVGQASSAASIILQAADERLMTENSYVMIHAGEEGTEGHPEIKKRWDAKLLKDNQWMEDLYLEKIKNKKPKFPRSKLAEMLKFDTILEAKESVEMGLADGLFTDTDRG